MDRSVETSWILLEKVIKLRCLEQLYHSLVSVLFVGVEIESQSATKDGWVLRNDRDAGAEMLDLHIFDVHIVYEDLTSNNLDDSAH